MNIDICVKVSTWNSMLLSKLSLPWLKWFGLHLALVENNKAGNQFLLKDRSLPWVATLWPNRKISENLRNGIKKSFFVIGCRKGLDFNSWQAWEKGILIEKFLVILQCLEKLFSFVRRTVRAILWNSLFALGYIWKIMAPWAGPGGELVTATVCAC